ncbi:MAG: hypothetical protein JNM84_02205 [Planctomycetes bacterium]|nr:hypothetical protein [Planctomycetota bacterium]
MSARKSGLWRRFRAELRAKPRHALALMLLVPVLIAVWLPLLQGAEAAEAPFAPAAPIPAALVSAPRKTDLEVLARLRPRLASWNSPARSPEVLRDPFTCTALGTSANVASDPAAAPSSVANDDAAREAESAARSRLGATFLSPGRPAAARIDGRLLKQGEPFGVFVLEEVGPRWVSLRGRHGRYRLEMVRSGGG